MFVTNTRFLLQHQQEWHSIWHNELIHLSCDGHALHLQKTGSDPARFEGEAIDYFFVLHMWFAFHEVVRPPAA